MGKGVPSPLPHRKALGSRLGTLLVICPSMCVLIRSRAVARALIGGGVYSYIRVMPD